MRLGLLEVEIGAPHTVPVSVKLTSSNGEKKRRKKEPRATAAFFIIFFLQNPWSRSIPRSRVRETLDREYFKPSIEGLLNPRSRFLPRSRVLKKNYEKGRGRPRLCFSPFELLNLTETGTVCGAQSQPQAIPTSFWWSRSLRVSFFQIGNLNVILG